MIGAFTLLVKLFRQSPTRRNKPADSCLDTPYERSPGLVEICRLTREGKGGCGKGKCYSTIQASSQFVVYMLRGLLPPVTGVCLLS